MKRAVDESPSSNASLTASLREVENLFSPEKQSGLVITLLESANGSLENSSRSFSQRINCSRKYLLDISETLNCRVRPPSAAPPPMSRIEPVYESGSVYYDKADGAISLCDKIIRDYEGLPFAWSDLCAGLLRDVANRKTDVSKWISRYDTCRIVMNRNNSVIATLKSRMSSEEKEVPRTLLNTAKVEQDVSAALDALVCETEAGARLKSARVSPPPPPPLHTPPLHTLPPATLIMRSLASLFCSPAPAAIEAHPAAIEAPPASAVPEPTVGGEDLRECVDRCVEILDRSLWALESARHTIIMEVVNFFSDPDPERHTVFRARFHVVCSDPPLPHSSSSSSSSSSAPPAPAPPNFADELEELMKDYHENPGGEFVVSHLGVDLGLLASTFKAQLQIGSLIDNSIKMGGKFGVGVQTNNAVSPF